MAKAAETADNTPPAGRKRFGVGMAIRLIVLLGFAAAIFAWTQRKQLADDFIAQELESRGVSATYKVTEISTSRQVLTDIVIGDPQNPDLTVERVEVLITPRLGYPTVSEVRLTRPRLFGALRDGQLSFGELDAFIFTGSEEPFEFPDLVLRVNDGRALVESEFGRVGLKLTGRGHLRGGFAGELAATVPQAALGGCSASGATLYGQIGIDAERPHFTGPVRFASLDCENGLALADGGIELDLKAERNLVDFEGNAGLRIGRSGIADASAAALEGDARFTWRDGGLTSGYKISARDFRTSAAQVASLQLDGQLRAPDGFERIEIEGDVAGTGVRLGDSLNASLASANRSVAGTMLEPLIAKFGQNLTAELAGGRLLASFNARRDGEDLALIIPQADLRGRSGDTLLALSRAQLTQSGDDLPRFDGNLATGGEGLPRIAGRMEQAGSGPLELNLRMQEYAAGDARLAVPELRIVQSRAGRIDFTGRVLASGALPGGFVDDLVVPLDGTYSANGALAVWNGCRDIGFNALSLSGLALQRETLTLCPAGGRPILRMSGGKIDLAAGVSALDLRGDLGGSPLAISSGPVGFAWPGSVSAKDLAITLGPRDNAVKFTISQIIADLDPGNIGGSFSGTDVVLPSVPLDILQASGDWRYVDERLQLTNGAFVLEDREATDRFEPLVARDAVLTFVDNLITADAVLRHPRSDIAISRALIKHDLTSGTGHADLLVDGIPFSKALQPYDLTRQLFGVVSLADGIVSGTGRIDWDPQAVTSNGEFSTDTIDLAAAFGPLKGVSGNVVFTDLLGLTTAPNQRLRIAAVNPGIEVYDGEIAFNLRDGSVLNLEDARWPFLGGTLSMSPLTINIGVAEERTYEMVIEGLEAARFVEHMELNNLSASGTFDGSIPIVFDPEGNGRLQGGILVARNPGGSLSYVGQLSYEDLSFVGNLAFGALRDLQFDGAEILMDGPLTGELVTKVRFEGIGQGATAQGNFITRQIAKLPIRLLLNIRAPFYQLISTTRSLYDPSAVRDPRSLGLLTDDGTHLRLAVDQQTVDDQDARTAQEAEVRLLQSLDNEPDIQPTESEVVR